MAKTKKSLLDRYYKRPLLYDVFMVATVVLVVYGLNCSEIIKLDFDCESKDIAGIGITVSGFILTIITILLTLKSTDIDVEKNKKETNSFKIFLASNLYSQAISILKNGVLTLLVVSFITLSISIFLNKFYCEFGVYANMICIVFIILIFLRSFYVLNLILKMQDKSFED